MDSLLVLFIYTYFHVMSSTHAIPCTYRKGLRYKECSQIITVNWFELPPYVYRNGSSTDVEGVMKIIIEKLLRRCCGQCVDFDYLDPLENSKSLEMGIGENDSVLNYPVYGKIITNKFDEYPYFPLIEAPGIIYVTKMPPIGQASKMLMTSVAQAWPILVVIFFMSAVVGIITWATDSYINPDQFPSPFFKGAWDGFWWALVSMTTVGYGDKAPRGYTARTIAFVWILIGLCLYAIFSGFISTSSTAGALGDDVDLFGKELVAFNQTVEQRFGVQSNAKMTVVNTFQDFVDKIVNEEVTGGLIDSYFAGHYEKELGENSIIVGAVLDHQFAYGFTISNNFTAPKIERCIRRTMSVEEQLITGIIETNMNAVPELSESEIAAISTALFDYRSPIFQKTIRDCGIILAVLCLLGFGWEFLYKRPRMRKEAAALNKSEDNTEMALVYASYDELVIAQNMELETAMKAEVKAFLNAFDRRDHDYFTLMADPAFRKVLPELFEDTEYHFIGYD